jgi:hypothetical protein
MQKTRRFFATNPILAALCDSNHKNSGGKTSTITPSVGKPCSFVWALVKAFEMPKPLVV